MTEIPPPKRSALTPLFKNHVRQRVVMDAILEQPYGDAHANADTNPQIARLQLGAFRLFGGDPNHPETEELIKTSNPGLFIAENDQWKNKILNTLGDQCSTYLRTGFSFENLNRDHIHKLAQKVPLHYKIHALDFKRAESEFTGTAYATPEKLYQNGIGFCALRGNEVASVAIAYTNSNRGIEVQIYTYDQHKQKGLATCTSAALIAYCLENNIDPHWSAANAISANLAQKLGYTKNDEYEAIVYRPHK